jgi:hypothetical protein
MDGARTLDDFEEDRLNRLRHVTKKGVAGRERARVGAAAQSADDRLAVAVDEGSDLLGDEPKPFLLRKAASVERFDDAD